MILFRLTRKRQKIQVIWYDQGILLAVSTAISPPPVRNVMARKLITAMSSSCCSCTGADCCDGETERPDTPKKSAQSSPDFFPVILSMVSQQTV